MGRSEALSVTPGPISPEDVVQLYAEHATSVERWVLRLFGPGAEVQDLVHDVFVIAYRGAHRFRGEASVATWLFRITARVVRKRRRREALKRWLFVALPDDVDGAAEQPAPDDEAERQQRVARLYAALARLPERHRTPIILHEIEGLPCDEIARLLGLEVGAVWVRLHRARARLQKVLARAEKGVGR
jgi:RNA polymerase sigma-70 factor (ECF subfamily)